jgi:hypothetical protein
MLKNLSGTFAAVKAFAQSLSANPILDAGIPSATPAKRKIIFTFGSNEAGVHLAGAAKCALDEHGAILGQGVGRQGDSYAIPTKGHYIKPGETQKRIGRTLPLTDVENYVNEFLAYAVANPDVDFMVTQIGTGYAGFDSYDIAPLFGDAPSNCWFDTAWQEFFEEEDITFKYWGTFDNPVDGYEYTPEYLSR